MDTKKDNRFVEKLQEEEGYFAFPAIILRDNYDKFIESGGKSRISKKTERKILSFFIFMFNSFVFGNVPAVVVMLMKTAFQMAAEEIDMKENWFEGLLKSVKDFSEKAEFSEELNSELKKFEENNGLDGLFDVWNRI